MTHLVWSFYYFSRVNFTVNIFFNRDMCVKLDWTTKAGTDYVVQSARGHIARNSFIIFSVLLIRMMHLLHNVRSEILSSNLIQIVFYLFSFCFRSFSWPSHPVIIAPSMQMPHPSKPDQWFYNLWKCLVNPRMQPNKLYCFIRSSDNWPCHDCHIASTAVASIRRSEYIILYLLWWFHTKVSVDSYNYIYCSLLWLSTRRSLVQVRVGANILWDSIDCTGFARALIWRSWIEIWNVPRRLEMDCVILRGTDPNISGSMAAKGLLLLQNW